MEKSLEELSRDDLITFTTQLLERLNKLEDRMVDKNSVAEKAGMSVSWLDNSQCEKAKRLRAVGVRYGTSQTSAVRYPLSEVIRISKQNENSLSSTFSRATGQPDQPTIASSLGVQANIEHDCN